MGDFVRGETGMIIGTIDKDISSAKNIELWINTFGETFVHNKGELSFIATDEGKTRVGYQMTQTESLSCCEDYIAVQIRWVLRDGTVGATKRKLLAIDRSDWDSQISQDPNAVYDVNGIGRITEPEISTMMITEDRKS